MENRSAAYERLSQDDGDKQESESIRSQRALIQQYVDNNPALHLVAEYADDGWSGTNFDRPDFKRMMDDAAKGRINCIFVKDLSRFGRDYIGVGEYLEQIFPLFHIRFIAINDRYDSDNYIGSTMGIEMVVANLVNSMYSRDAGKKLYSANKVKWEKGYSTSGRIPFGYIQDPERKGRYAIDPEAAKIVRRIFDLALAGWNTSMIAQKMNEEGHLIPSEYNRIHKVSGKEINHHLNPDRIWDVSLMGKAAVTLPTEVNVDADFTEAERKADVFGNAEKLTKEMADAFIESVYVHEGYRIEIVYRFADCLVGLQKGLEDTAAEYEKMR